MSLPRGIRNNNPLNIRRSKDKWQGLRALQTDTAFCQFETMAYGWRAAFVLLTRTYYHTSAQRNRPYCIASAELPSLQGEGQGWGLYLHWQLEQH